ncbi:MAG TPA: hypothetical protein EYP23_06040 [Thermoplasmata archaeon]|nr:hypothetical protein [Thermoplasmata archaeon]
MFVGTFLLSQTGGAQLFTSTSPFSFTLGEDVTLIVSGKTMLNGVVTGVSLPEENLPFDAASFVYIQVKHPELTSLINKMLTEGNLNAYPLFMRVGETNVVDTVHLVNMDTKEVETFENMQIVVQNSSLILSGTSVNVDVTNDISYVFFTIMEMEFVEGEKKPFLALLTDDTVGVTASNSPSYLLASFSLLTGEEDGGIISLRDQSGSTVWSGSDREWLVLIDDNSLSITFQSSVSLIPLETLNTPLTLKVEEAEETPDLLTLIEDATTLIPDAKEFFASKLQLPGQLFSSTSPLLRISNGGCVLIGTNQSICINGNQYRFENIGLLRFTSCDFELTENDGGLQVTVEGSGKLLFLGEYVYNTIPTQDVNGFPVPLQPIAVWVLAVGVFILFTFALKKRREVETEEELGKKKDFSNLFPVTFSEKNKRIVKWGFFLLYIALVISVFLLFNSTFEYILGVSALSCLSNGSLLLCGVLLSLQLLCMTLAYFFFALPTKIAAYAALSYIGLGEEGKWIGKSAGLLAMWLLGVPYLPYVFNILIMFFQDMIPFTLGGFGG